VIGADPFDVRRAVAAPGLLREFNDAGVLAAADVHVARRLGELAHEDDEGVLLAAALAVRAPRIGHVHVDLATIRDTATVDAEEPVDVPALPWPAAGEWIERVAASALAEGPLRLDGSWLYLDRYWREERRVADDLLAIGAEAATSMPVLRDGLERIFGDDTGGRQCLAAATAVLRRLAVVAGGPGTGKTTTVARIVALLAEQAAAAGRPAPLVALAAPTGKAAARLEEAVHEEARALPVGEEVRARLLALEASTLHRLLGWRPGSHSRFRHHRGQRLPHDVVIVDETSMVSLSLMARLVEAVRPDARLVLVGDPGQLASIEAGAVLGDVVGPAVAGLRLSAPARARLAAATGREIEAAGAPAGIADGIVTLDRVHRFGGAIARLADAIRAGDADAALDALGQAPDELLWIPAEDPPDAIRESVVAAARAIVEAARAGDAARAIAALKAHRILCAHRRGPHGVATWNARVEGWLAAELDAFGTDARWYAGRPLLVTDNDYELGLYNGDTGVVVQAGPDRTAAAFERRGEIVELSPARLGWVETVYAMTIHKSQGSQFGTAAVLLPPPASRILTRELLYTAATRAERRLIVVGSEETIATAIARPIARASGLRRRLWA
jgi:exodeoxyribonuclease V alpha subunit